ncbi:6,7-dimethyl-8-ribityllumazine synthase [Blochmannia endosymbiont of Colobopsis nipponica]|uniref:6,7-dimethyl-8-ribityllumazine synthase n=1 Tax=Blochmannia endosymbiont of Colobopsis nipponica TaxID=2681987 RepID=UPI00177B22D3|nr:6,7-dimethyl-8-ribityllumazine synthase [Blochmannia endosymbiont of Colobopsis nipponica]QOI11190.1 6,7-dimethyl-8-ribityllumazine synthase [Blochmannia endosymbiont of Colobopsis nipponica]
MKIIQGIVTSPSACVAIVVVRFNKFINNSLLEGAIDVLKRIGHVQDNNIVVVWVPGTYELPVAVLALVNTHKYDAIIALGTVIRGDTAHFEFISNTCSISLSKIAMNSLLPIAFGVLTTDNIDQAIERVGIKGNNKGAAAAMTVLEMINVLKAIHIENEYK